ncbi:hypothetical protein EO087_01775 [Dyella sp. M7H15-1]|uniref:hypothetical protein n=1 Tax=Dyella sp. M7H15-1 TaxID=2501295 RepID=UPI001004DB8C|nr:hypothetical protein [Dyella sp. M7H15-1]QAU22872.1 hypothetical protein EO087_01775 [Dyella sp. M7H15-1]
MTTPRTGAHQRILAALGSQWLTAGQLRACTGMSNIGIKSTLLGMQRRGELRRRKLNDGCVVYAVAKGNKA